MQRKSKLSTLRAICDSLYARLASCDLCPRNCRVNRLKGERGICGITQDLMVYTAFLHHGEEPLISGSQGSGTIFFSGCSLKCIYCQNYMFSHQLTGSILNEKSLAAVMLNLQGKGAHNINLVTPTHVLPQILKALLLAHQEGLNLPIVYNTSGYEKPEIIRELSGIVDIYLPDIKYMTERIAKDYSNAPDYPFYSQESIKAMHAQRSAAALSKDNLLLKRGVIIRHLVLPNHSADSLQALAWIKKNAPGALVSVMFQYQPYFKAQTSVNLRRRVNVSEYNQVKTCVEELGLKGWVQELDSQEALAGVYFDKNSLEGLL
ncbi:MAG: radical SAM protein [Candidatus Omnitrophica bacterium]|nr:radical SAM protein [Candidatus Omnitrophota bacterium]